MTIDVLYEDSQLLVVNKPPGVLSQPDATGDPDVQQLAAAYLQAESAGEKPDFLAPVHRLDRPASGIMVLARSSKAARRLAEQFRERFVEKRYLAIVEGRLEGWGEWEDFLLKEEQRVQIVSPDHPEGQYADMRWHALAQDREETLVLVRPRTGRPHQIRLQLASRGYPILGDFRYGASRELDGRNLALHAYWLALEHPTLQEGRIWQVEPPENWGERFRDAISSLLGT